MTFSELKIGDRFRFQRVPDCCYFIKMRVVQGAFGWNWNTFSDGNPTYLSWTDDEREVFMPSKFSDQEQRDKERQEWLARKA